MTYQVDLFYGDIGFTNDYSNVLHFANATKRDEYFDADTYKDTFSDTDFNAIQVSDTSLKIAFTNPRGVRFDLYNYCRIKTEYFVGSATYNITKYYFVTAFNVISSSSNLTTVEFAIELDVWQNYQFNFDIKECNVDRSHVDRWNVDGTIKYLKPTLDAIECNNVLENATVLSSDMENCYVWNEETSSVEEKNIEVAWVIVTAVHTLSDKPDQLLFHIFPVKISNLIFNNVNVTDWQYFIQNSICRAIGTNGLRDYYPSLQMLDNSFLVNVLNTENTYGVSDTVKVVNIQILMHTPFYVKKEVKTVAGHTSYFNRVCYKQGSTEIIMPATINLINGTWTSHTETCLVPFVSDLTIFNDNTVTESKEIIIASPIKPIDGVNYNIRYEPMMYRQPVITRYITAGDNSCMSVIPDILMFNKDKLTVKFNISYSSTSMYSYITLDTWSRADLSILGFALNLSTYNYDFLSDAWYEYCVTQRDSDRQMMFANIITGGISEAGSTAVSAGIGYRSNVERAKRNENRARHMYIDYKGKGGSLREADFYKTYASGSGYQVPIMQDASMYRSMARQAMAMSAIGGVSAFAGNAISNAMSQSAKERSIKNTPATLASSGNVIGAINNNQFNLIFYETVPDSYTIELYKNIFIKFGYAISGLMKPDIYSRKYFNYIKTNGAILTGNLSQYALSQLANIFDNGVTIWHMDYTTKNTLYTYDKENIERSLIE